MPDEPAAPSATPEPSATLEAPAAASARITAIEYAGRDEYVEIANEGPLLLALSGWVLTSSGQKAPFAFPVGYVLPAGGRVRVHSGPEAMDNPPGDLKWSGAYLWNNEGDEAALYDAAGNLVDRRAY
ncbi:MAG TPA: lamin tail domain-containing protein [Anaerolineae bacterium]|nr:lamin tail domain-containing protein [Anaerolineae bacterium]HPL30811.1 lamin tail domain-containing protein [Anaerolineae bacterium]